jgi:hypothetical protein
MSAHSSKTGLVLTRKNALAQACFEHANGILRHSEIDCSRCERLVVRRVIEHAHIELQSEIMEIDPFGMWLGGLEFEDIPPVLRLRIVSQEARVVGAIAARAVIASTSAPLPIRHGVNFRQRCCLD